MPRFTNRWIVVTETNTIAKGCTFKYRTYASKRDAIAATHKPEAPYSNKRRYVVDRDNMGHVILP